MGQRALINAQPIEWDGNAAASQLLRAHRELSAARTSSRAHVYLVRSLLPPGDPNTLVSRTIAFLFTLCDASEEQA